MLCMQSLFHYILTYFPNPRFVRHAVCEIDNKYHSFSTNLGLSSPSRHKMAAPLRTGQVVLVTGGSGFLGQHIVKLLQERADHVKEVRVFDTKPFIKQLGKECV